MSILNDLYPSKFLSPADVNGSLRLTISDWEAGKVGQGKDERDQLVLSFSNHDKQWGLNKTNAFAIGGIYGENPNDWQGEDVVVVSTIGQGPDGRPRDVLRVDEKRTRQLVQQKLKANRPPAGPPPREPGSDDDLGYDASGY